MSPDFFATKATRHFRNVVTQAFHHAALQGTKVVTPLHLLCTLSAETGSIGEEILRRVGLKREQIIQLMSELESITLHRDTILSPNAKRAIEKAVARAARDGHAYIGTEHLLYGLVTIESADIDYLLRTSRINKKSLEEQMDIALKSANKLPEMLSQFWDAETRARATAAGTAEKHAKQKSPALEYFGVELTNPQHAQRIDPVIGREMEIERLVHILARRTKNNPLLLGEPGVGKTAIVEGLAKRIVAGEVPPHLLDKKIYSIDLGLMIAGTMYRGEFEGRIKQLIDEVKQRPDIVLFIDEVHTIVGAGSSSGTLDAANLLKPALARGELRVIGATTFDEYKKHIEHDAALERRFQPITVSEPTALEATAMLQQIKNRYEQFHGIHVTDEAIDAAVRLSGKYLPEKHFPDKAIDLLDEAMSAAKIATGPTDSSHRAAAVRKELTALQTKKSQAVLKEDYETAQQIKLHESRLVTELEALMAAAQSADPTGTITGKDITAVIGRILHRPINDTAVGVDVATLSETLRARIIGHDDTVATIVNALAKAELGLQRENRPLASFLFAGSTGVGKTELARLIADGVYHDPKALIRVDMSEFSEGFSVSKMLGAPAGYVGHRESVTLADRLRRQPLSVLVFDEVNRAHPDVMNVLLTMLEEGRLTDAAGKEASVKQAVIIMTVQLPAEELTGPQLGFASQTIGSQRSDESIRRSLTALLRPELLNRVDHLCIMRPLTTESLERIAQLELENLAHRLGLKQRALTWDDTVPEYLAANGFDLTEGARRVRHLIDTLIERPLIEQFAAHPAADSYTVCLSHGILSVEPTYGRLQPRRTRSRTSRAVA